VTSPPCTIAKNEQEHRPAPEPRSERKCQRP
jgi:hypothetical protein